MVQFKIKKIREKLKHMDKNQTNESHSNIEPRHGQAHESSSNPDQKDLFTDTSKKTIKITTKHGVNISIIISLIIIAALCALIIKVVLSIDVKTLLLAAGEDLQKDSSNHTNFLILGTGGGKHDGADLTDTMMVASLNQEKGTLSVISIPRDLYVKDSLLPSSKINEIYFNAKKYFNSEVEGLNYLQKKVEEIANLKIQYYIKIDFSGFVKIIDTLGGIDIDVPEAIYDPYYPKEGTIYYETFSISKGPHHLDGTTALKYARSRETSSDFDRSSRQQQIIYAIKDKALQTKTFLDQDKLKGLLSAVKDNMVTNMKVRELLTLGAIASNYSKDKIINRLIHDDPVQCGGFLYTPQKEFYGGIFVLIPAGGDNYIQEYIDLSINNPEAFKENAKIQILNGTKKSGVAAETKQVLKRFCFNIVRFGNGQSKELTKTTIYYKMLPLPKENPDDETKYYKPYTVDALKKLIPMASESTTFPQKYIDEGYDKNSDIILELGSDYVDSDSFWEDPFYALYSVIYSTKKATTATQTTPGTQNGTAQPGTSASTTAQ